MLFPILSSLGVFSATYYSSLKNIFVLQPHDQAVNTPVLSQDVSWCPGYTLHNLEETRQGLSAQLWLAGPACNAFGQDVTQLTVHVTYETSNRLHVKISDSSKKHFTIPESVIPLSTPSPTDWSRDGSDLVFNYDATPFAFWITRRSAPDALPLFDTRISSLPPTPVPAVIPGDTSTALNGFPLVFEDRYLQLTSALPLNANIYGLGEVVAKSGFRRNTTATVQTMWARDVADPVDENVYGSHPFYLEHRLNQETGKSSSHGVFLFSSAGSDILLLTPPNSKVSLIEYRLLGGILDFYFFSGPSPAAVTEQYGELIGLPLWQPIWGFGFHLCRWGYQNLEETRLQVEMMRKANVPLEVMWNDIDLYHAVRDFTTDPVSYPAEEVRKFVQELESNHQRYIPILDAAVPKPVNKTDLYQPYTDGVERGIFLTNPDGSEYVGQVWPGYTVFPDWFNNATQAWWTDSLKAWYRSGVEFAGLWSDMNEVASFCDGSCGSNIDISDTSAPFILPGDPGNPINDYPECYDAEVFGPSGNMTVNGRSTCVHAEKPQDLTHGGSGVEFQETVRLDEPDSPAYHIHNGFGHLSSHTVSINATHAGDVVELDVHNLWGMMSERASYNALLEIRKGKRPFQISRSTFPSAGRYTGHWLGDNHSKWSYLYYTIQGVLQFQLFQIPFVGADTCGFAGNSNEDLCSRWMQLSAFTPFYRNHNIRGALPQEPYRWDTVAESSRIAIGVRYQLLPYWYTLFANSSLRGTPPMRALWFEFPEDEELYGVDRQFMVGSDILVTPVLSPDTSFVEGLFPGRNQVTWRDWYTHQVVNTTSRQPIRLEAPATHIPVHIRSGSALLLHAKPGYTIQETRSGPFSLLVSLSQDGAAFGTAYLDDGESYPPGPSTVTNFHASEGKLEIRSEGSFDVLQRLDEIIILGVRHRPIELTVNSREVTAWRFEEDKEKLVLHGVDLSLNSRHTLEWK